MTHYWVAKELSEQECRQIEALATCWKRERHKAATFIESAKRAILTWQAMPKLSETAVDIRDRAAALKAAANDLNQVLSGASPDFLSALQANVRDRLLNVLSPARHSALEAWQHLSAYHNGLSHPEPPQGLRIPDILDPLQELLSLVSEAAGGLESDSNPRPGRSIDHELWLIDQLIKSYRAAFDRMPGKSADSPFLSFWEGLKPIIGAEASYQAVIEQIRQLEKPTQN